MGVKAEPLRTLDNMKIHLFLVVILSVGISCSRGMYFQPNTAMDEEIFEPNYVEMSPYGQSITEPIDFEKARGSLQRLPRMIKTLLMMCKMYRNLDFCSQYEQKMENVSKKLQYLLSSSEELDRINIRK